MCGNDNTGGAANLAQFLNGHGVSQHIAAGAAQLFGEVNTHHAQLSHFLDSLFGEAFLLVNFLRQRLDFVLSELLEHFLCHCLLFGQLKVHLKSSNFHF